MKPCKSLHAKGRHESSNTEVDRTCAAAVRPDGGLLCGGLALFAVGWLSFSVVTFIPSNWSGSFSSGCLGKTGGASPLVLLKTSTSETTNNYKVVAAHIKSKNSAWIEFILFFLTLWNMTKHFHFIFTLFTSSRSVFNYFEQCEAIFFLNALNFLNWCDNFKNEVWYFCVDI